MTPYIQVITTTNSKKSALEIQESVLNEHLAACVQIIHPISSRYWWEGNIDSAEEWMLIMKSREDLFSDLEKKIESLHPYDSPEIVAIPFSAVGTKYVSWLERELRK